MKKILFLAIITSAIGCFKLSAQPVLYGVTQNGGTSSYGILFKFDVTTNALDVRKTFINYSTEGANPFGTLLYASNRMLYGTTSYGGTSGYGTLYEYDPETETFTTKANFDYTNTGAYNRSDLTEMDNGDIIGVSNSGGTYGYGTIWKYEIATGSLTKLKDFDSNSGGYPQDGGIIQASNGKLYGSTWSAGASGGGTLYELDPTTNSFTILQSFNYSNGAYGIGKVVEVDGKIFGVTHQGGASGYGTIFEYDITASSFTTRYSFDYGTTGAYPYVGLNLASNGLLYGTNLNGGQYGYGTLFSFDPQSGNVNKIHDFNYYDDGYAYNPVMQASDGNLYGMTHQAYHNGNYTYGSIYKYDIAASAYSTLKTFDDYNTGAYPFATGLTDLENGVPIICRTLNILKSPTNISCNGLTDGAIDITVTGATSSDYSFLWSNGATTEDISNLPVGNYFVKVTVNDNNGCSKRAYVKITQPAALTPFAAAKKVSFNGTSDGSVNLTVSGGTTPYTYAWSNGATTEDVSDVSVGVYSVTVTDAHNCQQITSAEVTKRATAQSDLYGVTQSGGSNGSGTLFKLDYMANTLEVKHSFTYSSDGGNPVGKLLEASNGLLYGTTVSGGTGTNQAGTLFEYDPSTEVFTKKADFDYYLTGANPYGHPIQLANGDIIGTCVSGGANGYGTIWKYNIASNTLTKLKDFDSNNTGAYPYSGITQAFNGKLYGLTYYNGPGGYGTLYEFDIQTNSFVLLVAFNYSNGAYGFGKLKEVNGKLFGVTYQGGTNGYGTIFEYDITTALFTTRHSFNYDTNGAYPYVGLNQATNGLLYGTTNSGGQDGNGTLYSFDPQLGGINKVHDFNYSIDGYAYNPVMQASDGNLYGMTYYGSNQTGSIYQFDIESNTYATAQNFDSATTGAYPFWTELTEIGQVNIDPCLADNTAPTVLTKNITIQLDENGTASIAASEINDGSTDNCTIASYALDKSNFDCSNVGDNMVTLTVIDASGNSASATATVTVEDKIAPTVVTKNITIQLDANGNALVEAEAVNDGSTDNCTIASYGLDKVNFDCTNVGANIVTLTVTDITGNAATATATIKVEDNIAPIAVTKNITIKLDANGKAAVDPTDVNNGSTDNCTIGIYSLDITSFDCSKIGANTVIFTVTDLSGNSSSTTATITVEDNIKPMIVGMPADIILPACGTATWATPVALDNCQGAIISKVGPDSGSTFSAGSTTVITYTATDASGNQTSSSFTVGVTSITVELLAISPEPVNTSITLSAKVLPAAAGIPVAFYLDAQLKGTGITNAEGVASIILSPLAEDVYAVKAIAGAGCSESAPGFLPVFDPAKGFATGAGSIDSPPGAFTANTALTGKSRFGFVAKYKKGTTVPQGHLEFYYKKGRMKFEATSFEWLVVAGNKTQFKGQGILNFAPNYSFLVTALDLSSCEVEDEHDGDDGDGNNYHKDGSTCKDRKCLTPDRFRIVITSPSGMVVYDNQLGKGFDTDAASPITRGSIEINDTKSTKRDASGNTIPQVESEIPTASLSAYPNPVEDVIFVKYVSESLAPIDMHLIDLTGKRLKTETFQVNSSGEYEMPISNLNMITGMYLLRVAQEHATKSIKVIKK